MKIISLLIVSLVATSALAVTKVAGVATSNAGTREFLFTAVEQKAAYTTCMGFIEGVEETQPFYVPCRIETAGESVTITYKPKAFSQYVFRGVNANGEVTGTLSYYKQVGSRSSKARRSPRFVEQSQYRGSFSASAE